MLRQQRWLIARTALLVAVVTALVGCGGSPSTSAGPKIDTNGAAPKVSVNRAVHGAGGGKSASDVKSNAKAD